MPKLRTSPYSVLCHRHTNRGAPKRELDRIQGADNIVFRWYPPGGGKDTTYLIIWAPCEPKPGWQG